MAKLKEVPITQLDLEEFLRTASDFAFELDVLQMLVAKGYECQHGGSYVDPTTSKRREFDIRARGFTGHDRVDNAYSVALAVECKNIRDHCPLLVSCVPRRPEESFHQVFWLTNANANVMKIETVNSRYHVSEPTGKSCAQVGRNTSDVLTGTDGDLYDKWTQALGSATDFFALTPEGGQRKQHYFAVLPIVVVPNERLWVAVYDANGKLTQGPVQRDSIPYFVNHPYQMTFGTRSFSFAVSHIEIMTRRGFEDLATNLIDSGSAAREIFHQPMMEARIA